MRSIATLSIGVFFLIVAAVFFGGLVCYVGVWLCFVQSFVSLVETCKAPTTDSQLVLEFFLSFFLAGPVAVVAGMWGTIIFSLGGIGATIDGCSQIKLKIKNWRK